MKTTTKYILAGLATALFATGSSMASDPQAIDNHHGAYIFPYRPAQTWSTVAPTVAFTGHGKGLGNTAAKVQRTEAKPSEPNLGIRAVMTAHGNVSYYAPVE